jgi:uncharacterized membrane protein YkvI
MSKSWGIALTYVGVVVGAGFSSGQEIWYFFARHQVEGILGVILTGVFFFVLAPILFQLGRLPGVDHYHQLFYNFLPVPLAILFDLIHIFLMIGAVSVMLAGSGAIFRDYLGLHYYLGVLITMVIILLTLFLRVEGIMIVNSVMIPFLIIITVITVITFLFKTDAVFLMKRGETGWFTDAVLYLSYNMIIAVAVMTGIISGEKRDVISKGGTLGGVILFILNLLIYTGLVGAFSNSLQAEIPMLYLAQTGSRVIFLCYILVLYFAMVSTAIANYYAFNQRIAVLFRLRYEVALVISIFFVLPPVPSGFSLLVRYLYPLFGYLGLCILAFYFYLWLKSRKILND